MNRVPVRHRSRSPDVSGPPTPRRRICLEPQLSPAKGPAPSPAASPGAKGPAPSPAKGPALRPAEGPAPSPAKGPAAEGAGDRARGGLSAVEWRQLYERVLPNPFEMGEFQRVVLDGKLHDHFLAKDLHKVVMELRVLLESHGELRMAEQLMVKGRKKDLAHAVATALQLLEKGRPRKVPGEAHAAVPLLSSSLFVTPATPQRTEEISAMPQTFLSSSSSLPCGPFGRICLDPPTCHPSQPPNLSATEIPVKPLDISEAHEALDILNETNSPFLRVLHVAKRAQLRFGSFPMRFDVPARYADAVAARRLRVQIIPLRHPATPARWPAAKDIVVYVNGQCFMTPWKRGWPERRVEVAKSFLPLDITQYLNRNGAAQQLHINVFAREYFSQLVLVVAQPRAPEDVVADMAPPLSVDSDARDAAAYDFYRLVVDDEDALAGEVEVADPVIATKCPILQTRIVIPVRGARCRHLQCFDCQSFLLSCHKGCYWNCPLCDAELRPRDVVVDSVLWRYISSLGDDCASHLRLCRASGDAAPFRWAPHALHGGSGGLVVDDEDEEDEAEEGEMRKGAEAAAGEEKGEKEDAGERIQGGGGTEKEVGRQLGTAACPIEL